MEKVKILGICGSLRKDSYNLTVLKHAADSLPAGAELEIMTLEKIPMFNQDLEYENIPEVKEFKEKIEKADAILFVSPEYNYSVPGVLKNAIDLASRPWGQNSWAGKPAAIMGASIASQGTARMQQHLRQIMVYADMYPLNRPEFMFEVTPEKINENKEIVDEKTKEKISEMLQALVDWTKKMNK